MSYRTKLRRRLRSRLDRPDKIKIKQYKNDETTELVKRIRTDISFKENKTLVKKKRSKLCYKSKEVKIEVITSNIYEI